jgi:hypothetical protein
MPRLLLSLLAALATTVFGADLFHDDFSHFPPGRLSGLIGELTAPFRNITTCRTAAFHSAAGPDLAANVVDLTGDKRDEVVLWDQQRVWIYTQDRPFQGKRIYAPIRNPDYNESNYRTNVSLPPNP